MSAKRVILTVIQLLVFLCIKIPSIVILLLCGRPSLALYLWGPGWVCTKVAYLYDADNRLYSRERWKITRKIIYARNRQANGGNCWACEVTGHKVHSLEGMAVDHILPRSRWPMLAYDPNNLRLIKAKINRRKSDKLPVWFFIRFAFTKRVQ